MCRTKSEIIKYAQSDVDSKGMGLLSLHQRDNELSLKTSPVSYLLYFGTCIQIYPLERVFLPESTPLKKNHLYSCFCSGVNNMVIDQH